MQTYKIDFKHQVKSLSNGLWNIILTPIAMICLWLIFDINPFEKHILAVFLLYSFFWFIPALILHRLYFLMNKNIRFTYNTENGEYLISEGNKTFNFYNRDIKTIERIYFSDYRVPNWQQNWFPMPWRNYGLIRILTIDNEEFFLTSLMIDIVKPPVKPTINKYRFIPLPPKTEKQKQNEIRLAEQNRKNKIDQFKTRFAKLSNSELKYMSKESVLVDEAKIAINELMNERNTTANMV